MVELSVSEWIFFVAEGVVAFLATFGNLLIIVAFSRERHLRTTTNSYILSLAVTDLLVGAVGIPFSLFTMLTQQPAALAACLLFNTWILMLCTVSILHLLAVSYDRYLVIVRQSLDSPLMKNRRAHILIASAWILGGLIGLFPIMGWNNGPTDPPRCVFMEVMDLGYLVFLYIATIITPTLCMAFFYTCIYITVRRHHSETESLRTGPINQLAGMRRLEKRRRRIVQSLSIVIASFLIGWYPLYTLNTIAYFRPDLPIPSACFFIAIVLTHMTSAINPFIYAHTMPGFKDAFHRALCCEPGVRGKVALEKATAHNFTFARKISLVISNFHGNAENESIIPRRFSNISPAIPVHVKKSVVLKTGRSRSLMTAGSFQDLTVQEAKIRKFSERTENGKAIDMIQEISALDSAEFRRLDFNSDSDVML